LEHILFSYLQRFPSTLNSPVTGNVVQSKHVGRDIMAGLKTLVGGEIKSYTEMLTEARHIAISRLVEEALKLDVDAPGQSAFYHEFDYERFF
jgi:hypothetical protein